MSITSSRVVQVQFSGDISTNIIQSALDNTISPGQVDIVSFVLGANTVTAPVVSGLVVTALTIIPPSGNIAALTLKGITGDLGIPIHVTDPTSIALSPAFVSLVINAAAAVVGVRLIWS